MLFVFRFSFFISFVTKWWQRQLLVKLVDDHSLFGSAYDLLCVYHHQFQVIYAS